MDGRMGEPLVSKEDFEKLADVDKISEIIRNMNSSDQNVREKAIADGEYLTEKLAENEKKQINKSFINKKKLSNQAHNGFTPSTKATPEYLNIDAFKAAVATDAEERTKRRTSQRIKATKFKAQANEFFKVGDWKRAINLYTQAIEVSSDWSILYTNRAQAFMRVGKPQKALADCDIALRLLPMDPKKTPTDIGEEAEEAKKINLMTAKALLHRGKALLVLQRPKESLKSYSDSKLFKAYAIHPSSGGEIISGDEEWPTFLQEYVAQAEAAIAAAQIDSEAQELMQLCVGDLNPENSKDYLLKPSEQNFLRLIAEAACGSRSLEEYTSILRQMTKLLDIAAANAALHEDRVNAVNSSPQGNGDMKNLANPKSANNNRRRNRNKPKNPTVLNEEAGSAQSKSRVKSDDVVDADSLTLSQLQSFFRIKNGFSVLKNQMQTFYTAQCMNEFLADSPTSPTPVEAGNPDASLHFLEHLLTLLTVCYQLVRDCGENQRRLVETIPNLFGDVLVNCLRLCPTTSHLRSVSRPLTKINAEKTARYQYNLGIIRCTACELLAVMSLEASGREGLLTHPGPAQLFSALATTLSDALGLPKPNSTSNLNLSPFSFTLSPKLPESSQHAIGASFSMQTIAAVAQILENLTESPHFLTLVRNLDCFKSVQDVVEAAISVPSSSTTAAPTECLGLLLDSLSTACCDIDLRKKLVAKPRFVQHLANCLTRHAPLMSDDSHASLVGSLCRLLHNCLTGEDAITPTSSELDALLKGTGLILDQPSRGSTILSVVIALLGKIIPMSTPQQIEIWCHTGNATIGEEQKPKPKYNERVNIMLTIITSYSASVLHEKPDVACSSSISSIANGKVVENPETLAVHRLRGSVRALAAICKAEGCEDVRIAIGDDRVTVRRLANLVRVRVTPTSEEMVEKKPLPRDEPLAANVCLVLQACVDDTCLAELLEGTPIIMDLLKLIQESNRLETKRNAAVVVGRLASASHIHRTEMSRLDGMSVLAPFNRWANALGGDYTVSTPRYPGHF